MEVVLTEPEAEGKSLFIECRIFRAEPACEASTYWAKTELPEVLPMPDFFKFWKILNLTQRFRLNMPFTDSLQPT